MKPLNSKEIRHLKGLLKEQYGYEEDLSYVFLKKEDNIFLVNKDVERIDLSKLRLNTVGFYFGELRHDKLRLSRDGAQMIGPHAKINVFAIDKEQVKAYYRGEDIPHPDAENGVFVILKYGDDYIACGRCKAGVVQNFLSKTYRTESVIV